MSDLYTVTVQAVESGFDSATKAIDGLKKKVEDTAKAEGVSAKASDKNTQSKQRLTRATKGAGDAQNRVRQQFLATANSIAVLDGPLGGVASRFSAFGVLIGRIGVPLAAVSVGLTTLGVVMNRTVRNFAEFEVQTARIDAILRATSNTFGTTAEDINSLAASISLVTLESEQGVQRAATQLLTFRNISRAVFADVLNAAADLSAAGFGNMESATTQLAKALEDPRQGLTSLSRAGVTFTRQQRSLIMSLIETGDRARAMELILANVNRQVGGVAEASARDTLAGDFDTIGQALNRASRGVGEFLGELVRLASSPAAAALAGFAAGPGTLSEQLATANAELRVYIENQTEIEDLQSRIAAADIAGAAFRGGEARNEAARLRNQLNILMANLGLQEDMTEAFERRAAIVNEITLAENQARQAESQRIIANVDGILEEISMRERLIGLTDVQARNTRNLADAELLQADINNLIRERINLLVAEGMSFDQAVAQIDRLRGEYERVTIESLNALSVREEMSRQAMRIAAGVQAENDLLDIQLGFMEDGFTATVARRLAQIEVERQIIRNVIRENELAAAVLVTNSHTADGIKNLREQARLRAINIDLENALAALDKREATTALINRLSSPDRSPSGGGTDPNREFQRELDALNTYLARRREEMMIADGFERELVNEQYEERFTHLQNALDRRLISEQDYADRVVQLTQSREDRISEIERSVRDSRLGETASFFGAMAAITTQGGDKLVKATQTFGAVEALINTYRAQSQVLADPTLGFFGKMAAYATIGAAGLNVVNAIRGAGGGRGGGGGRTANAPREAREQAPQRVLIQGLDPSALYTGEQLQNLFEAFYGENNNRGNVFVVSQ